MKRKLLVAAMNDLQLQICFLLKVLEKQYLLHTMYVATIFNPGADRNSNLRRARYFILQTVKNRQKLIINYADVDVYRK